MTHGFLSPPPKEFNVLDYVPQAELKYAEPSLFEATTSVKAAENLDATWDVVTVNNKTPKNAFDQAKQVS